MDAFYNWIITSYCFPNIYSVGFLVHKNLTSNVVEVSNVSTWIAYLVLKLTDRYLHPKINTGVCAELVTL